MSISKHLILKAKLLVFLFSISIVLVFLLPTKSHVQTCNRRGNIRNATIMYDRPPKFITGKGLMYSNVLTKLSQGTQILICQEARVGLWPAVEHWYQIAYWSQKQWWYGWVKATDVQEVTPKVQRGKIGTALRSFRLGPRMVLAAAPATEPLSSKVSSSNNQDQEALGKQDAFPTPEELPEGKLARLFPTAQELPKDIIPPSVPKLEGIDGQISQTGTTKFYLYFFGLILAGMLAKVVVDLLESSENDNYKRRIRRQLPKLIIPFFVSPIVFGSVITSTNVEVTNQTEFFSLLVLAFQNGFFWQTIIHTRSLR